MRYILLGVLVVFERANVRRHEVMLECSLLDLSKTSATTPQSKL